MSKFSSSEDNGGRPPSETGSCCGEGTSETLLCPRPGGGRDSGGDLHLLDVTCDSSFASVCDDGGQVSMSMDMSMAPQNTSTSTDVFQNFLLCGFEHQEERELQELQQRAMLIKTTSPSNTLHRQQGQRQQRQLSAPSSSADPCQLATMPRFLWQSSTASQSPEDAGLCCRPGELETSNIQELYTESYEDDIFSFVDDNEGEEGVEQEEVLNDSKPLLPPGDERSSCGYSSSSCASDDEEDELVELGVFPSTGGTVEDPQYVPRPSSTTPSLREMSQMFRTASLCDDDDGLAREPVWQAKAKPKPSYLFEDGNQNQQSQLDSSYHSSSSSPKKLGTFGAAIKPLDKKKASPLRPPFMHRKTRSEEKFFNSSVDDSDSGICLTSIMGTSTELTNIGMPRARTADYTWSLNSPSTRSVGSNYSTTSTATGTGVTDGGGDRSNISNSSSSNNKKGKHHPMMKLLRRTRLPTLRKQNHKGREKSPMQTPETLVAESPIRVTETPNNSVIGESKAVGGADVVDILASLELTLRTRSGESGRERRFPMPRIDGSISPTRSKKPIRRKPSPTGPDPPSLQLSGETQSVDSSSVDDVFSGVHSDADDTGTDDTDSQCSSAPSTSSSEDSRSTVDRFLSSPYSNNPQSKNHWSSQSAVSPPHGFTTNRYPYRNQEVSRLGSSGAQRSTSKYYKKKHPYHPNRPQDRRLVSGRQGTHSASMLSSPSEFIRNNSVDTTKASNLGGLGADRARLLDLQAFLWQQQKQEIDRLNAPPIDFETPDGDGVIRVQEAVCETIDAACEIEVLPKLDMFSREASSSQVRKPSQLPPTAAEF